MELELAHAASNSGDLARQTTSRFVISPGLSLAFVKIEAIQEVQLCLAKASC